MYNLIVENKAGERLELTHNSNYVVVDINGLNPPEAIINATRSAGADGSVFNSAFVDNRTIIITLAINEPAEKNRIALYRYFSSKNPVRLYYSNGTRNVYIDGFVKGVPIDFFAKKQTFQVTIFCPNPFFNVDSDSVVDFSLVRGLFEFPFSVEDNDPIEFGEILTESETNIINYGDTDSGAVFVIRAKGSLTNPVIYNAGTGEYFGLTISLSQGDEIRINTKKKQKSAILIRSGVKTSVVGNMTSGSTWLQLAAGDNLFTISAATNPENMSVYCIQTTQYEGV